MRTKPNTSGWIAAAGAVALVAAVSAGCGRAPEDRTVEVVTTMQRPYVPAGTDFSVRLDGALSSRTLTPDEVFTATVVTPIVGADRRVLVPAGAKVRGRILGVSPGPNGTLRLAFDSIDTARGLAPLSARIEDPGVRGVVVAEAPAGLTGDETVLESVGGTMPEARGAWGSESPIGGGPLPFTQPSPSPWIELDPNALVRLTLTRPLWLPRPR